MIHAAVDQTCEDGAILRPPQTTNKNTAQSASEKSNQSRRKCLFAISILAYAFTGKKRKRLSARDSSDTESSEHDLPRDSDSVQPESAEQNSRFKPQLLNSQPGSFDDLPGAAMDIEIQQRDWNKPISIFDAASIRSHASSTGNIRDDVNLNDLVVCVPTEEARQLDLAANYRLPFSIGRVLRKKESGVLLVWLYAPNIDSAWHTWEERVKDHRGKVTVRTRKDEIEWQSLLRDQYGVLTVSLCKDHCLSRKAVLRLKGHSELAMREDQWASYFRVKS